MFDPAVAAVEGALAAGAEYADARVVVSRRQGLEALNDTIESALRIQSESQKRHGEPDADAIRTELGMLHFRRSA